MGNLIGYTGTDAISGVLAYDALNRKTGEIINFGTFSKEYSYSYDAYGNKDSYTSSEGMIHTYSHDLAGRLTALSVENQTLSLGYDKTRLTQISYPNGVTTTYSYNNADWLTNLTASGASGTLLSREYDFDAVGNITGALGSKGITSYTYDPTDQLTVADHPSATALSDELYSYDAVGNRLSSTDISGLISYNANNELIGHTTVQYQYDANGNTTEKTANGQTTTYDYNSRNRLSRVHLPDGRLVSYRYDPFGRRISKTVAGVTTCYTYSDEGLAAEYDGNGTWQKSYGWKPDSLWGTDPVYQRTATGLYYYHNDHLGTPQRLSDESGDIAWSAGYTAFGNATVDPILSSIDNNLRFPGQYFDQETGLHYNYQRFYDPGTGRYTQVDPIGFLSGNANHYRYVGNIPVNWIDPEGLTRQCPARKELINADAKHWRPYPGNPVRYHCGFDGYLEVREKKCDDSPIAECFYDHSGNLVDETHQYKGCRGTADEYPVPSDWWNHLDILWNHFVNDKGGPNGPSEYADNLGEEAYQESRKYFRENPTYRTYPSGRGKARRARTR
nr:RHS repeat-associated core domain-containing protein [uncultured Desulfuromonas sp.]